MSRSVFSFLQVLFTGAWKFFSEFYIPGTNVTPAGLFLLVMFITITIKLIKKITYNKEE